MSGASSDQVLNEAYELIEAENHDEAQALLKPILEQEPDNVDAWWLYAHAVTDPEAGRMALNQVLRLDDSFQEARALLTQLDRASQTIPDSPPNLPEDMEEFTLDDTGPIFDDRPDVPETEKTGQSGPPIALVGLLIIAVLGVVAILLLNPLGAPDTQTEDQQTPITTLTPITQQTATIAPTNNIVSLTSAPVLEPVSSEITDSVTNQMADFELLEGSVGTYETTLGKTLLVSICTSAGTLRDTLSDSMDAMANISDAIADDIEAIGVALLDCDSDRLLRVIATSAEDATAYNSDEIDAKTYQARWIAAA